jgi:hypothetical protein
MTKAATPPTAPTMAAVFDLGFVEDVEDGCMLEATAKSGLLE